MLDMTNKRNWITRSSRVMTNLVLLVFFIRLIYKGKKLAVI